MNEGSPDQEFHEWLKWPAETAPSPSQQEPSDHTFHAWLKEFEQEQLKMPNPPLFAFFTPIQKEQHLAAFGPGSFHYQLRTGAACG